MDCDQHTSAPNTCIPSYKLVLYIFQDSHPLIIYSAPLSNPFLENETIAFPIMVQNTSIRIQIIDMIQYFRKERKYSHISQQTS